MYDKPTLSGKTDYEVESLSIEIIDEEDLLYLFYILVK